MFNKIKLYFQNLKFNSNLLLICLSLISLTIGITVFTNYKIKNKELNLKIQNTIILEDILVKSKLHEEKSDSAGIIANEYIKQIDKNEKIDWTRLYTSDPDSIAREITEWNTKRLNSNK